MESYNAPKDQGYTVGNNYANLSTSIQVSYGGNQAQYSQSRSLPIYEGPREEQQSGPRKSRCPNGAALGKIGSACLTKCSRACAIEG